MPLLALLENDGLPISRKGPNEYTSPCPACGGDDRFIIRVDGKQRYWCRQCGVKGDAIEYLRSFHGLSFAEAAEQVGREITNKPTTTTIRPTRPRQEQPAKWGTEAKKLIDYAHRALIQNTKALSWLLAERGIRRETAECFRLGWIERNLFVDKDRFGLPADGKKLFIPSGLLIPRLSQRIRVRRDNPDKYGRYYVLPGSDTHPLIIGDPHQTTGVIVESELDAILLSQETTRPLYIVALGSTSTKLSTDLVTSLWSCPVVLVALDSDDAGATASRGWMDAVPGAFRTPTPGGKDLTESYLAGVDLNTWLSVAMELYCENQGGVADENFCRN
ncbi:MAG: toprim domain-containing protein [Desulfobulbaceae bacterium]|nr:toprim domain-containing protein [Desulfobulbaceae bacterium]